jgi:hypothetical protein
VSTRVNGPEVPIELADVLAAPPCSQRVVLYRLIGDGSADLGVHRLPSNCSKPPRRLKASRTISR